jgi:hypothetical protein
MIAEVAVTLSNAPEAREKIGGAHLDDMSLEGG